MRGLMRAARIFFGALALALISLPALAAQGTVCMPVSGTVSGVQFSEDISAGLAALISSNSGASAPTNGCGSIAVAGQLWYDTAGAYPSWKISDGADWLGIGFVDPTNHIFMPQIGGGIATLIAASTTDLCATTPQDYLTISGTIPINTFGSSCQLGQVKFLNFTGGTPINYNAADILTQNSQSITTVAGDQATAFYLGGGVWRLRDYQTPGELPGGSTGAVQWNNGGAFAGASVAAGNVVIGGGSSGPLDSGTLLASLAPLNSPNLISPILTTPSYAVPNASGSTQTTTAACTSGSPNVTLAATIDFKNGEGINLLGCGGAFAGANPTSLNISHAGTAGSTSHTYKIACIDPGAATGVASLSGTTTTSNGSLNGTNYNVLSWTAGAGCAGYAIYRDGTLVGVTNSTGFNETGGSAPLAANIPQSAPAAAANENLVTTVIAGAGTRNITLAADAGATASSAPVLHDDTIALQTAINALPPSGGEIKWPPVIYNISSSVSLGNGTGATGSSTSTANGMVIKGSSLPGGWGNPSPTGTILNWVGPPKAMVVVEGFVVGWGFNNIAMQCNDIASAGLYVLDGEYGKGDYDSAWQCQRGFWTDTYNSSTGGSAFNEFHSPFVQGPDNGFWQAYTVSGNASGDSYDNNFYLCMSQGSVNSQGYGVYLGASDDNGFYNCRAGTNVAYAIDFDFSINTYWPANNDFFGFDGQGQTINQNGSPGTSNINIIYGLQTNNGSTCPSLSGLSCHSN